jgi:hypothetical protein
MEVGEKKVVDSLCTKTGRVQLYKTRTYTYIIYCGYDSAERLCFTREIVSIDNNNNNNSAILRIPCTHPLWPPRGTLHYVYARVGINNNVTHARRVILSPGRVYRRRRRRVRY